MTILSGGKLTSKQIQKSLARSKLFGLKSCFCVIANLSWGLFDWGEADYVYISKSYYLTEIEIKISINDLVADFSKKKWGKSKLSHCKDIKNFYYCVPLELKDKALELINQNNPEAGLISIDINKKSRYNVTIVKSCVERKADKIPETKLLKIMRLAMFRYWSGE